jgi:hypothetical protein
VIGWLVGWLVGWGEENLEWMKELDRKKGEVIGAPYAEAFKHIEVW